MDPAVLGVVLDSSVIIAAERKQQTIEALLLSVRERLGANEIEISISAISVVELVHGVARAGTPEIRERRRAFIERA